MGSIGREIDTSRLLNVGHAYCYQSGCVNSRSIVGRSRVAIHILVVQDDDPDVVALPGLVVRRGVGIQGCLPAVGLTPELVGVVFRETVSDGVILDIRRSYGHAHVAAANCVFH